MKKIFFNTIAILILSFKALAMDAFELQVYDAEINAPDKVTIELHLNNIVSGLPDGEYVGQYPPNHLTHLTFEFALGLKDFWEVGAYLQTAKTADDIYKYAGMKLRSRFVIPRSKSGNWHLGANFELSSIPHEFEMDRYSGEIRPTVGYETEQFEIYLNPIMGVDLSKNADATPSLAPALKVAFPAKHFNYGVEYYSEMGPINSLLPLKKAEQYIFPAVDLKGMPIELNFGIGRGLNGSSNPYIAKLIFGIEI